MTDTVLNGSTVTVDLADYAAGGPFVARRGTSIVSANGDGVYGSAAEAWNLTNWGEIGGSQDGVDLAGGGRLANGVTGVIASTSAGGAAVAMGMGGRVVNNGQIEGMGVGVHLYDGGVILNNPTGLIVGKGGFGVEIAGAAGVVDNAGTIRGPGGVGVELGAGGQITNEASGLISGGRHGVEAIGAPATVTNGGTIKGAAHVAIKLEAGGEIANAATGVILGDVLISGAAGAVTNAGTIEATGTRAATVMFRGGDVADTLSNGGTIIGFDGGLAVRFGNGDDRLIVDPGAVFVGGVHGGQGGNTLELAAGASAGTLSGLGFQFVGFKTIAVDAGATWTLGGDNRIHTGATLASEGALTIGGTFNNHGVLAAGGAGAIAIDTAMVNSGTLMADGGILTVAGDVTGSGSAMIAGGLLDFAGAFGQTVAFTGPTGVLELGRSQAYAGSISGFSATGGDSLELDDIGFVSADEASFAGDASGGVLTITDGAHTAAIALVGDYLSSIFSCAADGHGGVMITDSAAQSPGANAAAAVPASPHALASAIAALAPAHAQTTAPVHQAWRDPLPCLASSRGQLA